MTDVGIKQARPPDFISSQTARARRFYLNLKPPTGAPLAVICGGWEECSADYVVDRSGFPFLGIEFVAAGEGEVVLAGKRHELVAGSLFSYGPGISQRIVTDPKKRLMKYFVDFTGRRGRRLLRESRLNPGTFLHLPQHGEMRARFDQMVGLGQGPTVTAERACVLQLELILLSLVSASYPARIDSMRAFATFERCRSYIDEHFLGLSSADAIASRCNVDASYLCRLFQRFGETPPFQYLQRLQMQWAAERLHRDGLMVREVADDLGIDPFQFSRTFKRLHGVSPQNFVRLRS